MRHRKAGKKLGRSTAHRKAMFRNMLTSLVLHERIVTTDTKAKAVKRLADRLISLAKKGDLNSRRLAVTKLYSKDAVAKLFDNLGPRFRSRAGGYTRVIKVGYRLGDGAPQSIVEWTEKPLGASPGTSED